MAAEFLVNERVFDTLAAEFLVKHRLFDAVVVEEAIVEKKTL